MIPTVYKSKISSKLSWPVGAEKMSEVLADLPQLSRFRISFPGYDQNEVFKRDEIYILHIEYAYMRAVSESAIMPGHGIPKWEVRIYPIPREVKHKIRELLEHAFKRLREWCYIRSTITGTEGCERITVILDPNTNELRFDEFSNVGPKVLKEKTA